MYDGFYGFRDRPFSLLPDPDYLYLSPQHEKALGLLELSLHNQAGFCVISGEIGAGKTTLIRKLLTLMGDEFRVGLVTNTLESFGDLMNWILTAFSLPSGGTTVERHERFIDYIIAEYGRGRRTVLIVDEAQNLTVDALEELRMLSNVNADKHQVLQIILVGQPGLRETLKRPELTQFAQRILMDFHLAPLGREDTARYIRHRLLVAGADPELFAPDASAALYRYSGGIPRIINLLCDTALVYGYAEGSHSITAELVHAVVRERQHTGGAPALRLAAMAPVRTEVAEPVAASMTAPEEPEVAEVPAAEAGPSPEEDPTGREVAERPQPAAAPESPALRAESETIEAPGMETAPSGISGGPVADPVPEPQADPAGEARDPEPVSDAEWLRRLADSAIPAAARARMPEPPVLPDTDKAEDARPPASSAASRNHRRRSGLGMAAGLVALVLAGAGAAYWYGTRAGGISGEAPAPESTASRPEVAAVPAAPASSPPRKAVAPQAEAVPEPVVSAKQGEVIRAVEPQPRTASLPAAPVPPQPEPGPAREKMPRPDPVPPVARPAAPAVQDESTGTDAAPVVVKRPVAAPEPARRETPPPAAVTASRRIEAPPPSGERDRASAPGPVAPDGVPSSPEPAPDPVRRVNAGPEAVKPQQPTRETVAVEEAVAVESPVEDVAVPVAVPEPAPSAPAAVASAGTDDIGVAGAEPGSVAAGMPDRQAASPAAEEHHFVADPCKGPAARYLSTCR